MRSLALALVLAACSSSSGKSDYSVCSSNGDCSSNMCVQHFTGQPSLCTKTCSGVGSQLTDCPPNGMVSAHCVSQSDSPTGWVCWP